MLVPNPTRQVAPFEINSKWKCLLNNEILEKVLNCFNIQAKILKSKKISNSQKVKSFIKWICALKNTMCLLYI